MDVWCVLRCVLVENCDILINKCLKNNSTVQFIHVLTMACTDSHIKKNRKKGDITHHLCVPVRHKN